MLEVGSPAALGYWIDFAFGELRMIFIRCERALSLRSGRIFCVVTLLEAELKEGEKSGPFIKRKGKMIHDHKSMKKMSCF